MKTFYFYEMKLKKLSVNEYAALRKISRQAVLKRLTPEIKHLPGVIKVERFGKMWILYTDSSFN
jgi:hypothetical protein